MMGRRLIEGMRVKNRTWRAVAVFVVATLAATAVLWWVQRTADIAWWVFDLTSAAPAIGAGITLALRRPLDLAVLWRPGFGFNIQSLRRSILLGALGVGIILGCVQFASMMRWSMRPTDLATVPYPFTRPDDVTTMLFMLGISWFVMAGLQELGWRSLLQPTLRSAYGPLVAGVGTGLVWGLLNPLTYAAAMTRWAQRPVVTEVGLFLIASVAANVGLSLLIMLGQQRMRRGHWISAVTIRWVLMFGFFLIFDEELGRWQPQFSIAIVLWCFAAVGLYYHLRGVRDRAAKEAAA